MITQELVAYVKSDLNKGKTREEIRKTLLASGGWNESDISEAFRAVMPLQNITSDSTSSGATKKPNFFKRFVTPKTPSTPPEDTKKPKLSSAPPTSSSAPTPPIPSTPPSIPPLTPKTTVVPSVASTKTPDTKEGISFFNRLKKPPIPPIAPPKSFEQPKPSFVPPTSSISKTPIIPPNTSNTKKPNFFKRLVTPRTSPALPRDTKKPKPPFTPPFTPKTPVTPVTPVTPINTPGGTQEAGFFNRFKTPPTPKITTPSITPKVSSTASIDIPDVKKTSFFNRPRKSSTPPITPPKSFEQPKPSFVPPTITPSVSPSTPKTSVASTSVPDTKGASFFNRFKKSSPILSKESKEPRLSSPATPAGVSDTKKPNFFKSFPSVNPNLTKQTSPTPPITPPKSFEKPKPSFVPPTITPSVSPSTPKTSVVSPSTLSKDFKVFEEPKLSPTSPKPTVSPITSAKKEKSGSNTSPWMTIVFIVILGGLCFTAFYFYRSQILDLPNKATTMFGSLVNKVSGLVQTEQPFISEDKDEDEDFEIPVVAVQQKINCGTTTSPDRRNPGTYLNDNVFKCLGESATVCQNAEGVMDDALFPTLFKIINEDNICKFELSYEGHSGLIDVFGKKLANRSISCPLSIVKAVDETDPENIVFETVDTSNFNKYASDIYFYGTLGLFIENNFNQNQIKDLGCSGAFVGSVIESYNLMRSRM